MRSIDFILAETFKIFNRIKKDKLQKRMCCNILFLIICDKLNFSLLFIYLRTRAAFKPFLKASSEFTYFVTNFCSSSDFAVNKI